MGIHNADCFDIFPAIPDKSVDLVLADPPYGRTRCKWDSALDLARLWPELKRIAKGPVILFAACPYDKVLGCSNLKWLRHEWVWEKSNGSGFLNAKRAPIRCHENILVFAKRSPPYHPIKTQGHERKTAVKRNDQSAVYGRQTETSYDSTERYPRSVLKFPSDKQRSSLHPSQKPLALMDYLVRTYSKEGDLVLDFTMGSGTTGVAALQASRRFVGIEKDAGHFAAAAERLRCLFEATPR